MNGDSDSDAQIIRSILEGDKDRFQILTVRYRRDLHLRANRLMPRQADCDDIVQETLVRAYFRLKDFRTDGDFRAWLYGIMRNVVGNAYSRAARSKEVSWNETETAMAELADRHPLPDENPSLAEYLGACMKSLGEKARRLVRMRYEQGLSGRNIGRMLAMSEYAVNVATMRVRNVLRKCIEDRMRVAL